MSKPLFFIDLCGRKGTEKIAHMQINMQFFRQKKKVERKKT